MNRDGLIFAAGAIALGMFAILPLLSNKDHKMTTLIDEYEAAAKYIHNPDDTAALQLKVSLALLRLQIDEAETARTRYMKGRRDQGTRDEAMNAEQAKAEAKQDRQIELLGEIARLLRKVTGESEAGEPESGSARDTAPIDTSPEPESAEQWPLPDGLVWQYGTIQPNAWSIHMGQYGGEGFAVGNRSGGKLCGRDDLCLLVRERTAAEPKGPGVAS